jgi:cellulose biosynthesis protein BcsQ
MHPSSMAAISCTPTRSDEAPPQSDIFNPSVPSHTLPKNTETIKRRQILRKRPSSTPAHIEEVNSRKKTTTGHRRGQSRAQKVDSERTMIAIYNHKGGVAKTTVAINLAYTLGRRHNVLLIEADQQCNIQQHFEKAINLEAMKTSNDESDGLSDGDDETLTDLSSDDDDDESGENDDSKDKTGEEEEHESPPPVHITRRNYPFSNDPPLHRPHPKYIDHVDGLGVKLDRKTLYQALYDRYTFHDGIENSIPHCILLPPPKPDVEGEPTKQVWLVPGTAEMMELEKLASKIGEEDSGVSQKRLAMFRSMIHDVMKKHDCPYAVIDFSPSAGFINRIMVTSCDYIIPPCFADRPSYGSSVSLLNHVLPAWFVWYKNLVKSDGTRQKTVKKTLPYILPFVVTNYGIRSNRVLKKAATWIVALDSFQSSDEFTEGRRILANGKRALPICQAENTMLVDANACACALVDLKKTCSKKMDSNLKEIRGRYSNLAYFIHNIACSPPTKRP